MSFQDEPILGEGRTIHLHADQSSVKLVRNAKGDTQIELKVAHGTTPEQMLALRELAYREYRALVEATGGVLPPLVGGGQQ